MATSTRTRRRCGAPGFDVHLRVASAGSTTGRQPQKHRHTRPPLPAAIPTPSPQSARTRSLGGKLYLSCRDPVRSPKLRARRCCWSCQKATPARWKTICTRFRERGGDLLLIGGAKTIHGLPRLPADMGLRRHLGGTASSITLRMARRWLASRRTPNLYSDTNAARWDKWAAPVSELERYDRSPASDANSAR